MRVRILGLIVFIVGLFGSQNLFAEQGKSLQGKTVPVAVCTQSFAVPMSTYFTSHQVNPKYEELPLENLTELLNEIKTTVCGTVSDASVKVWISADVQAKLWVIDAAGQSGIEVNFPCKQK